MGDNPKKNSIGREFLEAALDVATIWPGGMIGKNAKKFSGPALLAKGGSLTWTQFRQLMADARKFEDGIIKSVRSTFSDFERRVSLKLEDGTHAVFDGVGRNSDGTFTIVEAKMGNGRLSNNQRAVLRALEAGETVTPVGENAKNVFGKQLTGQNVSGNGTIRMDMQLNLESMPISEALNRR